MKIEKKTHRSCTWRLYILECSDGTFYTGITNDMERRLEQHNNGTASRYTRSRLPAKLLYQEGCLNKSSALKKECRIKALTRQKKDEYIKDKQVEIFFAAKKRKIRKENR